MRTVAYVTLLAMILALPSYGSEEIYPSLHPGFESGISLGRGIVQSSIGLGDIDQDGLPEIVVGGNDGVLYAFNGDGTPVVSQVPARKGESGLDLPYGGLFRTPDGTPILSSPTLADVDLDTRVDLFWGTDGGEVYHLELRLTSDPPLDLKRKSFVAPVRRSETSPVRMAPAPDEDDDVAR